MSKQPEEGNPSGRVPDIDYSWRLKRKARIWQPPSDVTETEDAFHVIVEIAGMRGSEFIVTCDGKSLTISGSRPDVGEVKAYHQVEISYGDFALNLTLPGALETEAIKATYADGFLRIKLPKRKATEIAIRDQNG